MSFESPRWSVIFTISQNYQPITRNDFYKQSIRNYHKAMTLSKYILVHVKILLDFVQRTAFSTLCYNSVLVLSLKTKFEKWPRRHLTSFKWGIPLEEGMLQSLYKCIFKGKIMTIEISKKKKKKGGRESFIPKKFCDHTSTAMLYWTLT